MALVRPVEGPARRVETADDVRRELDAEMAKRASLEAALRKLGRSVSSGELEVALRKINIKIDLLEGRLRKLA